MIFLKDGKNFKRFTTELVTRCDSKLYEVLGFLLNCGTVHLLEEHRCCCLDI